jgi:hypothetical protein
MVRIRHGHEFVIQTGTDCSVVPLREAPPGFLEELQELPGFDNGALISALARPRGVERVCWRR